MVLWIVGVMAVWTADPAAGRPRLQADLPVDSSVRAAEALLEQATADDTAGQSEADTLQLVREERRAEGGERRAESQQISSRVPAFSTLSPWLA